MSSPKRRKVSEEYGGRCCTSGILDEKDIIDIARNIGKDFHEIGISLGYSSVQLEHLEQIYPGKIVKRHHVMIMKWVKTAKQSGIEDQNIRKFLSKLIKEAGNTKLADYISSDHDNIELTHTFTHHLQEVIFDIDQDHHDSERERRLIDGWRQRDRQYQETRVYEEAKRILETEGCVTIIGPPGDGKTATCQHLALHMKSQGYCIIKIKDAMTLEKYCSRKGKQLLVLDDPIGRMVLDVKKAEEFFGINEEVQNAINGQQLKVMVAVRKAILEDCRSDTRRSFLDSNIVDMTSDALKLNVEERRQILKKYSIPNTKLQQLKTNMENYFPGFPLLCHVLSRKTEDVSSKDQSIKQILLTHVKDMKKHDQYRYCAMVLLAVADGDFDPEELNAVCFNEENREKPKNELIVNSCGLPLNPATIMRLKESFDPLTNGFLAESEGLFSFLHDYIYDVIVEHYQSKNLGILLKLTTSSFIRERMRVDSVEPISGFVKIPIRKQKDLALRMSKDIKDGQALAVLNKEYQLVLATELKSSSHSLKSLTIPIKEHSNMEKKIKMSLDAAVLSSSPIHWICRLGCTSLLKSVLEAFSKSPETILKSLEGHTSPLHFAAGYGHLETFKYLLSFNVDPNAKSSLRKVDASVGEYYSGFTPLFYAARENHVDVVECLLANGADPDIVRDHGASPMLLAADKGRSEIIESLIRHRADPNICCEHGTSPLFLASQENHINAVTVLLDGHANVNHQKPRNGMTPLMIASRKGSTETVNLLLKKKAIPNLANEDGNSALHLAAASSEILIVKLLLDFKADKTLRNKDDKLPIHLAEEHGCKEIVDLLN